MRKYLIISKYKLSEFCLVISKFDWYFLGLRWNNKFNHIRLKLLTEFIEMSQCNNKDWKQIYRIKFKLLFPSYTSFLFVYASFFQIKQNHELHDCTVRCTYIQFSYSANYKYTLFNQTPFIIIKSFLYYLNNVSLIILENSKLLKQTIKKSN